MQRVTVFGFKFLPLCQTPMAEATSGVDEQKLFEVDGAESFVPDRRNSKRFEVYGSFWIVVDSLNIRRKRNGTQSLWILGVKVPKGSEEWTIVETIFWAEPKESEASRIRDVVGFVWFSPF